MTLSRRFLCALVEKARHHGCTRPHPRGSTLGWTVAPKCWLMDGKFPPINGKAERTRTKHQLGACPWVGLICSLTLLRKRLPCKLFLLRFVAKMSFLLWNDQNNRVVFILSMLPPVFVLNLLPHETRNLDHKTPLLPTFCFKVAEAMGCFPAGIGFQSSP